MRVGGSKERVGLTPLWLLSVHDVAMTWRRGWGYTVGVKSARVGYVACGVGGGVVNVAAFKRGCLGRVACGLMLLVLPELSFVAHAAPFLDAA